MWRIYTRVPLYQLRAGEYLFRMKRQKVISSAIGSVGFDDKHNVLEVEFLSGDIYQYFGVPNSVQKSFMTAESKGRYYVNNIKDIFPFKKGATR